MNATRFTEALGVHPGSQPALIHDDGCTTYAGLNAQIAAFAGRLERHGVRSGERVIICLPNGPLAIIALLGTIAAGGVAVPVHEDQSAQLDELASAVKAVCLVEPEGSGGVRLSDCRTRAAGDGSGVSLAQGDATALIRFSSGYSGTPKGVCLTEVQICEMARRLQVAARLTHGHRELIITPIAFSGAWQRVAATLFAGGSIGFAQAGPLTVRGLLEDVQTYRATGFFATPSLLRILLAASPAEVSARLANCRSVEIGSASLAPGELAALLGLTPAHILVHYGLTECSRATLLDARRYPDKLHTVGRAAPGVRIAFAGDDGMPSTGISEGEVLLRAPWLTRGYWCNPALNSERFVDGWLRTRDLGGLDDDGFLVYRGRMDDQINCGGYSFFPAEVERLIGPVDGVREYVVAGVDDPRGLYGQVPWVFVLPADATGYRSSDFMRVVRRRLPASKRPRRAVIVSTIPRTRSGKVDRLSTVRLFGPGVSHGRPR